MTLSNVLTINGGSSSIKYAIFRAGSSLEQLSRGTVEQGAAQLLDSLERLPEFKAVEAVGHRVVHGMQHVEPELITTELLEQLRDISAFVPEHLPREIELIETVRERHPSLQQVACFDTAFHCTMPRVARMLPIPRRFEERGVRRYGFHGLSYAFLIEELARVAGEDDARGRVILAHLGGGASIAALREGKSVDTSMGFTPASGLMMGTRAGDVDPGLVAFLARTEQMTAEQFENMANHDSGLLGVSETSSDMRELLERERTDVLAAEAIALFCYEAKKWIGAFAAVLGGVDTIVFSGGIGENSPVIRARICEGLGFLGVEIDGIANDRGAPVISAHDGLVSVRVIRTDEELMIARSVVRLIGAAQ